jgi:hypothetical protein
LRQFQHAATAFAEQVDRVRLRQTWKRVPTKRLFVLKLIAERRNLPVPSSMTLDLDATTVAQWAQDLFVKAARAVWERFGEMRVPNPSDFLVFIARDLAERAVTHVG